MRDAYRQLKLSEDSKKLTTISTHKGLFEYRDCYLELLQRHRFSNRTWNKCYMALKECSSIWMTSQLTTEEHLRRLRTVFERFRQHGLRLKKEKCEFLKNKMGFEIDSNGTKPSQKKLEDFKKTPALTDLKQLETFVGYVNYYGS